MNLKFTYFLVLFLIMVHIPVQSQITTTKVAPAKTTEQEKKIDPTANPFEIFTFQAEYLYKKQMAYLLPGKYWKNWEFDNSRPFFIDSISNIGEKKVFYVDTSTGKRGYICYNNEDHLPIIPVVTLEYLEKAIKGNQLVIANDFVNQTDIETGDSLHFTTKAVTTFLCEGITIIDGTKELALILKGSPGRTYITLRDYYQHIGEYYTRVFLKSEWDKLVKRYGLNSMRRTVEGDFWIGQPETLLKKSRRKPDDINYSSYGNQYIYSYIYIYTRSGKVTGWN